MSVTDGGVGIVEKKYFTFAEPPNELVLESGKKLGPITLAYETYGELNRDKTNAILIYHALSGDSHAAGKYSESDRKSGWWDNVIGPGRAFDTNKYFMICANVIGGCQGSTGPSSIDPKTGKRYGLDFPFVTVKDMVNAQVFLIDYLGIDKLFATAGGSMGGMQGLRFAVSYPDRVELTIPVASTAKSSPQGIAFTEVGRVAIMSDPNFNGGNYYDGDHPKDGLALARMIGHITYLSDQSMHEKFGRRLQNKEKPSFKFTIDFEVESYLRHQGDTFVDRFDANSYLYITKAINYFDLSYDTGSLVETFSGVKSSFLVISYTGDWLYPSYQSKEIVKALMVNGVDVTYCEIDSKYGHDAFLLDEGEISNVIKNYLDNHSKKLGIIS